MARGLRFNGGALLARTVRHHAATNLAVLLGCSAAATVLIGALLVGDSMRVSLRELTLERLGTIDQVVVGSRFFRADLAQRLTPSCPGAVSVILIKGSVVSPTSRLVTGVSIVGVSPEFWNLYDDAPTGLEGAVVANEALAKALDIAPSARLIAQLQKGSAVPAEGLMGNRDDAVRQTPFVVDRIIPTRKAGRFSLDVTQNEPLNLFVPIESLAKALEQPGRANGLLLPLGASDANGSIERAVTLDDLGVEIKPHPKEGFVSIESREKILDDATVALIREPPLGSQSQQVLTYLANTIAHQRRMIPYSLVTALEEMDRSPLGPIPRTSGKAPLKDDEILLNQWAADELGAKIGDPIRLVFFQVDINNRLIESEATFVCAGVAPMRGLAIDSTFTPEYPGITDADRVTDWDPPFPVELRRIHKKDEDYWKKYRAAPKGFIALKKGQRLWGTRFGNATSVRIARPDGGSKPAVARAAAGSAASAPVDPEWDAWVTSIQATLRDRLSKGATRLVARPARSQNLAASQGSTDFGMLFFSFSIFLIASSAILVGLLFRLNTERRAQEVGLLLAVGFPLRRVQRQLLGEGLILASTGTFLGVFGGAAYATVMIAGLTSWWSPAVHAPFLRFHAEPVSVLMGVVGSMVMAMLAIAWSVWGLGKTPVPRLLREGFVFSEGGQGGRHYSAGLFAGSLILGMAVIGFGVARIMSESAAFFTGGILLLVSGLSLLAWRLPLLGASIIKGSGSSAMRRLGVRNAGRQTTRSVATVGLIAFATFVIMAIGVMRHDATPAKPDPASGNGGFSLYVETSVPLPYELGNLDALNDRTQDQFLLRHLAAGAIYSMRTRDGDDASCLNVFQPQRPRVLGVSEKFIHRGGFAFAHSMAAGDEVGNPWLLLNRKFPDGAIPAIGDANTLQWILKKGIGQDVLVPGDDGKEVTLRIVGSLSQSIFQGELLISQDHFIRAFPRSAGYRTFLIDVRGGGENVIRSQLDNEFAREGVVTTTTWERLRRFKEVESTYMSTFQTLGGLGLILGTFGLGAVLLRNVLERRGELALLSAVGYATGDLGWLVLSETYALLMMGIGLGSASALVAVLPSLIALPAPARADLWSLAGMMLAVVAAGLSAGFASLALALRTPLILGLRGTR